MKPSIRTAAMLCGAAILVYLAFQQVTSAAGPAKPLSSFDSQVKPLLAQMTLDEKIGQMTQAEQDAIKDLSEIERYSFGSILSGGSSDPKEGNSLKAWTDLYDRLQQHTTLSRLKIPILYGVDAVHGHNNILGAVIFPHNVGLGCTRNPALVEKAARVTAEEVRASGIQWVFAPCVTVPQDIRWGRTYEGFSEDPEVVKTLGEAAVRGLQGTDLANPLSVLACAKHYIGDGGTAFGSARDGKGLDQGDTRVDEATLRRIHLQGYLTTVKAGVASIMPSYNSWNGVKVSGDKRLLTDLLKKELGFEGFLISDYNAIDQIDPNFKKAIGISINAGMDMVMVPTRYKEYMTDLKQLVDEGVVPMTRIDDAVTRILRVKFAMGLLDPKRSQLADRSLQKSFGSAEHRAVARQAVRESLVLLKNNATVLPLAKTAARIHVAGKSADDIGNQCGGWTIDWQGKSGDVTPGGTTLLAAIKKAASGKTQVTFSKDGTGAAGATVGVVVIGERPYAEMMGDRADLSLAQEDLDAVANMKAAGIPVVVVVYSGRPVLLGKVLDQADAVVAAWLPGTEGAGITDVLFGDFKPTGKLSFTWPASMDQVANHTGPFHLGYGLTY
ncbi:MAG TPA: glycoside hydrolase family 3 N-terminal domain-containing protein [Candidatus Sulfopaludibacter sp.]|nr:glycoside hydrolase family 3 N-terminal domain-containing protein [Candidatus Sulfopaludibacter sp.]